MFTPKNSSLPLTKTRLNFYLAQRARQKQSHSQLSNNNSFFIKPPTSQYYHESKGSAENLFGASVESIGEIASNPSPPQKQTDGNGQESRDMNRQMKMMGERRGILKSRNRAEQFGGNSARLASYQENDSLDQLLSARKNDYSGLQKIENQSCLESGRGMYFFQHQNSVRSYTKPINWRKKPKKIQRTNVYFRQLDKNMKQISEQLSGVNYELYRNNKKLTLLKDIHKSMQRPTPQQSLKRANFKHSVNPSLLFSDGRKLKQPRVEYYDRSYNDPRYMIWNPLH